MSEHRLRELRPTIGQRFETGCIATLTRPGETRTLHFTGNGSDATRAVADYCDRGGWKVVTLSTPGTIYRDLDGSREATKRGPGNGESWFYAPPPVNAVMVPEEKMLATIKRTDLMV